MIASSNPVYCFIYCFEFNLNKIIKYFIIIYNTVKSDKFNYIIYYFETVVAGSCSCRITDYLFVVNLWK